MNVGSISSTPDSVRMMSTQKPIDERDRYEDTKDDQDVDNKTKENLSLLPLQEADAQRLLTINRGHWSIESVNNIIDWNLNEDRSCIRKGYGPENMTRLRRFAISLIKSKKTKCVAQKMRQLSFNTRMVFDYLKMTKNSYVTKNK